MKVWVVSMECGLNGHSVIAASATPISQEEADSMAEANVPGLPYRWTSVTGFGGAEVTELDVTEGPGS